MFSASSFQSEKCSPSTSLAAQRLTKLEYNNVIRDLFGLNDNFSKNFSSPSLGTAGFTTEAAAQNLSPSIVSDFYDGANAVVTVLFSKNPNPLLSKCNSGDACARDIITDLLRRAYRRPATAEEFNDVFALYKSANSPVINEGLKLAVMGILLSPQFIFRIYELPTARVPETSLTDYELASRLSFFIWGSIPDETLNSLAASGQLNETTNLIAQTKRMLADPKASYIAQTFGYQWSGLEKFEQTQLDTSRFPNWNDNMKNSMQNETIIFLNGIFSQDQSVMDIIGARYTYMDRNVASIYEVNGITSTSFQRVDLDSSRRGIMSQPAILSMNSVADHTSPVRRGKWVMDKILCAAPGSPPENVPLEPSNNGNLRDESLIRQRMATHRSMGTTCYACHQVMDPIGLTFENFDSMGFFRSKYQNGAAVDSSGELPTGEKFNDYSSLTDYLNMDQRFPRCFVGKFASFAQGRDMTTYTDRCGIESIAKDAARVDKKFSDVVVDIVLQSNFRKRKVSY